MIIFFIMAWRNLLRNKRRFATTVVFISLSSALFLILMNFKDGIHEGMVDNAIKFYTSHIQIKETGDGYIKDGPGIVKKIKDIEHVKAIAPRLEAQAFAGASDRHSGIKLIGIIPEDEEKVSSISEVLTSGKYLERSDVDKILIGERLADRLGVKVGDTIYILVQFAHAVRGSTIGEQVMKPMELKVKGIYRVGTEFDKQVAFVPLSALQEMLKLGGGDVSRIVVRVDDWENIQAVIMGLKVRLYPSTLEALRWEEMVPDSMKLISLSNILMAVIAFFIFALIAMVVAYMTLGSVYERMGEFGMMAIIGARPRQIFSLVMLECGISASISIVLGTMLGLGASYYLAVSGIDLGLQVVYSAVSSQNFLLSAFFIFLVVFAAAFYPAMRTLKVKPQRL